MKAQHASLQQLVQHDQLPPQLQGPVWKPGLNGVPAGWHKHAGVGGPACACSDAHPNNVRAQRCGLQGLVAWWAHGRLPHSTAQHSTRPWSTACQKGHALWSVACLRTCTARWLWADEGLMERLNSCAVRIGWRAESDQGSMDIDASRCQAAGPSVRHGIHTWNYICS